MTVRNALDCKKIRSRSLSTSLLLVPFYKPHLISYYSFVATVCISILYYLMTGAPEFNNWSKNFDTRPHRRGQIYGDNIMFNN